MFGVEAPSTTACLLTTGAGRLRVVHVRVVSNAKQLQLTGRRGHAKVERWMLTMFLSQGWGAELGFSAGDGSFVQLDH